MTLLFDSGVMLITLRGSRDMRYVVLVASVMVVAVVVEELQI